MPLPCCGQCTLQDNDDNDNNDGDYVDDVDDGAAKCYTHLNKIHIYHYAQRLLSSVLVVAPVTVVIVVVVVAYIPVDIIVVVAADIDNQCDAC